MISRYLTLLAIATPVFSLTMATLYYWVFSWHFPEFGASIFSISDYFDKAAELLWGLFIMTTLYLIFGFVGNFADEFPEEGKIAIHELSIFRNRERKTPNHAAQRLFDTLLAVFAVVFWAIPATKAYFFYYLATVYFGWLGYQFFLRQTNIPVADTVKYLPFFILVPILTLSVFFRANFDALEIRARYQHEKDTVTIDILDRGIVQTQDGFLIFTSPEYGVLIRSALKEPVVGSPLCRIANKLCIADDAEEIAWLFKTKL